MPKVVEGSWGRFEAFEEKDEDDSETIQGGLNLMDSSVSSELKVR